MARAALVTDSSGELKRQLILYVERVAVNVGYRRIGQSAVNLNRAVHRRTRCRIYAHSQRRIWRETERRITRAQFIQNLITGKRITRGAAANRKARKERWIATCVSEDYLFDAVVIDACATTKNQLVAKTCRTPCESKTRCKVVSIGVVKTVSWFDTRTRETTIWSKDEV